MSGLPDMNILMLISATAEIRGLLRMRAELFKSALTACVIAAVLATRPGGASAQDAACQAPAWIEPRATGAVPAPLARVQSYHPIFRQCHNALGHTRLAIRGMSIDGESLLLMVDPATLVTRVEHERCWTCVDTDDAAQEATRFLRAVHLPARPGLDGAAPPSAVLTNAGLSHGRGDGSFITGDLCPSRKPLDRGFLETLARIGSRTPVALSITGLWLTRHGADFQWLREQSRSGALEITWVNHSTHHPYVPGRPLATNFLLTPGVDMQAEILDTERLLIANGETPSVFFRFPGLVSDEALLHVVRKNHLVTLGADGWLAFGPPLRPGAILLVHPNGNEAAGLARFAKLLDSGKLPRPFRPIDEAP
jgi:hypothetical protein